MKTPLSITLLLAAAATAPLASGAWIVPGARWLDTDGNRFNAHAGGMYVDEDAGRFYWYGEYKTTEQPEGGGVSVYSSDDLATWEYHGLALGKREPSSFSFSSQKSVSLLKCFGNTLQSRKMVMNGSLPTT